MKVLSSTWFQVGCWAIITGPRHTVPPTRFRFLYHASRDGWYLSQHPAHFHGEQTTNTLLAQAASRWLLASREACPGKRLDRGNRNQDATTLLFYLGSLVWK
jgi:hypothetical protein